MGFPADVKPRFHAVKKQLHIALYSGSIPSTTFIERLIQGLADRGHSVYLFGSMQKRTVYGKNVHTYGYRNTRIQKLLYYLKYTLLLSVWKPAAKRKLLRYLKATGKDSLYARVKYYPVLWHRPDIFHVQWAKSLPEWMWVQDFGIKLVLSLRGSHITYSPVGDPNLAAQYRACFPKVDGFHAVSEAMAKEAERYGAAGEKIRVVYSGLSLEPLPEVTTEHPSVFTMLSVGRPHWVKGYTYALDACRILKAKGFRFRYTLIGAAGAIELHYQIKDLGLEEEVLLTAPVPFPEVQRAMEQADLLLLPSVEEGIANVVLEAMALGTPVLTTACGGMTEVIRDGVNGWVCPIRNPEAMAKRILEIDAWDDTAKNTLIAQAKATVAAQHRPEAMVQGMEDLYREVFSF